MKAFLLAIWSALTMALCVVGLPFVVAYQIFGGKIPGEGTQEYFPNFCYVSMAVGAVVVAGSAALLVVAYRKALRK
jgi:hypothetical protein